MYRHEQQESPIKSSHRNYWYNKKQWSTDIWFILMTPAWSFWRHIFSCQAFLTANKLENHWRIKTRGEAQERLNLGEDLICNSSQWLQRHIQGSGGFMHMHLKWILKWSTHPLCSQACQADIKDLWSCRKCTEWLDEAGNGRGMVWRTFVSSEDSSLLTAVYPISVFLHCEGKKRKLIRSVVISSTANTTEHQVQSGLLWRTLNCTTASKPHRSPFLILLFMGKKTSNRK